MIKCSLLVAVPSHVYLFNSIFECFLKSVWNLRLANADEASGSAFRRLRLESTLIRQRPLTCVVVPSCVALPTRSSVISLFDLPSFLPTVIMFLREPNYRAGCIYSISCACFVAALLSVVSSRNSDWSGASATGARRFETQMLRLINSLSEFKRRLGTVGCSR